MCDCDDNSPKVCGQMTRRARKPHRCSECRRTIAKGETYQETSGLWDGGWETFRWCIHCVESCKIINTSLKDFCFCYGSLWEATTNVGSDSYNWIDRHYDRSWPPGVARLIVSARRKWTYRRGCKIGQLVPVPSQAAAVRVVP